MTGTTPGTTQQPYANLRLEPATTVDRVAEELRRALFEGELEPGAPLREVALAAALGVSRSTVREALAALVAEGLADRTPNRGTQVRQLDLAAVTDICTAREVVEAAGVRRWEGASDEARAEVRRACEEYADLAGTTATPAQITTTHLAIHHSIAALTESPRLLAWADSLYAEVRLALAQVDRVRDNTGEQVHTHFDLLDLLEAGRIDAALETLSAHLSVARESLTAALPDQ